MPNAQGDTTVQHKRTSRRHDKRTRQSLEISQPICTTHDTSRSMSTPPDRSCKGNATVRLLSNNRTVETSEKICVEILQPVVIQKQSIALSHPPAPTLSGNFDLYGMYLPFLAKHYLLQDATMPDYAAVHDKILASQAKQVYTARCFLAAPDPTSFSPQHGRFESTCVLDPVVERPFDIILNSFTYKKSLSFTPTERLSFQVPEYDVVGPGLVGYTGLTPICGVKNAKGVFKIKRVWVKEQGGSLKELFEGFFSFSASYDSTYRKVSRGNGAKWKFAFWGVRAMKDNTGKEIGLGPTKL